MDRTAEQLAAAYALLADPVRLRLLDLLAGAPSGEAGVAELAGRLGLDPTDCTRHVALLADGGIVDARDGAVSLAPGALHALPHPADAALGLLDVRRPAAPDDALAVRPVADADLPVVLDIYAEGLATRTATFETELPDAATLRAKWLPGLAWVAELDGEVLGWTAIMPTSTRACYSGVCETSVYVAATAQGRGVGRTLLHTQVEGADAAGIWTLQTAIFPENRASLALHRSAGYRTLGVRRRVARLDGRWRDTVMMERRSEVL